MVKGIKGINWIMYKLHCHRNGLVEGNFKNLRKYMIERGI